MLSRTSATNRCHGNSTQCLPKWIAPDATEGSVPQHEPEMTWMLWRSRKDVFDLGVTFAELMFPNMVASGKRTVTTRDSS